MLEKMVKEGAEMEAMPDTVLYLLAVDAVVGLVLCIGLWRSGNNGKRMR